MAEAGAVPSAVASPSRLLPAVAAQTLPEDVQLSLQPSQKQWQTRQLAAYAQKCSGLLI